MHQAINLAPPERVRTCGDSPLRSQNTGFSVRDINGTHVRSPQPTGTHVRSPQPNATGTKTHLTWSTYQATWWAKECPSPVGTGQQVKSQCYSTYFPFRLLSDLFIYITISSHVTPVAQSISTVMFVGMGWYQHILRHNSVLSKFNNMDLHLTVINWSNYSPSS